MTDACAFRRSIDRHFAGTIAVGAERALRAHLPSCDRCDRYYRRHLVLEAMTPSALGAQQRLARGIVRQPRLTSARVLVAAAAMASVIAVVAIRRGDGGRSDVELGVRGAPHPASELVAFRIRGAAHEPLADAMTSDDELSFAVRNVAGAPYLVVFGVDQARRVYWYYPAWTDAARPPAAVAIDASLELVELPEAIHHDLAAGPLWVYAAFVARPWSTTEVEARVAAVAPGSPIALDAPVAPTYRVAVTR